jgi:hypothetical protein
MANVAGARSPATRFIPLGVSISEGIAVGINRGGILAYAAMRSVGDRLATFASRSGPFSVSPPTANGVGARGTAGGTSATTITNHFHVDTGQLVEVLEALNLVRGLPAAFATHLGPGSVVGAKA